MLKRKIGLILIIAGVAIFLLLMGGVLLQELVRWFTDEADRMKYESYLAMVTERDKGVFWIAFIAGFVPGITGLMLRWPDSNPQ